MSVTFDKLTGVPSTTTLESGDKFLVASNDHVRLFEVTTTNCGGAGYYYADTSALTLQKMDFSASSNRMSRVPQYNGKGNIIKSLKSKNNGASLNSSGDEELICTNDLFEDIINNKRIFINGNVGTLNATVPLMSYYKEDLGSDNLYIHLITPVLNGMVLCPREYFDKIVGEVYYGNGDV